MNEAATFKWRLLGGYSGEKGNITAIKKINFTFPPSRGLFLDFGWPAGEQLIEDEIIYHVEQNEFTVPVTDFNDGSFAELSFKEIKDIFVQNGWEVIDEERF